MNVLRPRKLWYGSKSLFFLYLLDLEMAHLFLAIETMQAITDRAEPSPSGLSGTRRHIERGTSAFSTNYNLVSRYRPDLTIKFYGPLPHSLVHLPDAFQPVQT